MRHTGTPFLSHTPPQASTALCGDCGKHTMQHCCPAPPWWWSWSAPASTRRPVARHAARSMPASFTAHWCRRAARSQPVLQRGVRCDQRSRSINFVMREYFPEGGTVAAGTTVAHQLDHWPDHWLSVKVAENSTLAGYLSAVKFWKPFIGEKQVSALKHSDILRAIKTQPDLSGKTVNNYVSALRSAMDLAVLDKLLTDNPVVAVPSAKWQREPPAPFDREEVERIIGYARAKFAPTAANLIVFRFFSGLRRHSID